MVRSGQHPDRKAKVGRQRDRHATGRTRLDAPERQRGIVAAATSLFAARGYSATTTAAIAAAATINEALVFRHFGSKARLYARCVEGAWDEVRAAADAAAEGEPAGRRWACVGSTFLAIARERPEIARVWLQSLTETTGDADTDEALAGVMRSAHRYVADAIRTSQQAGGVPADRDADAEAWMMVALGLLAAVGDRIGGAFAQQFPQTIAAHRAWITGSSAPTNEGNPS